MSGLTHATSPPIDLRRLRDDVRGAVLTPGDAGYDEAREVFNAAADRRPAAIVRPADAEDVAAVLTHARDRGAGVAVRGGGHSFAAHGVADGVVLLDMRSMGAVEIDPDARVGRAQGGATAGDYTVAADAHGLATGFGDNPGVGIAGLTVGGGIGYLVREHGLTVDDLLGAEVVTPDGEIRAVDAEREPDLFWALRGGGGNFGVVTELRFRLHPIGSVYGGFLVLPLDAEILAGFAEYAAAAPEALSMIGRAVPAPPVPFIPAQHHGELVLIVALVYDGDADAGREALAPVRALAEPIADLVRETGYATMFAEEGGPERAAVAMRTALTDAIDAEAIVEGVRTATTPFKAAEIRALGGAMARVPADATAFAFRDSRYMVSIGAMSFGPERDVEALEASATQRAEAAGLADRPGYVNYMGARQPVEAAYPEATLARLAEVKRRYDPDNVLRFNHNVAPGAA